MTIFEIKIDSNYTNNNLHSDILIYFPNSGGETEIVDSYYLFDGIKTEFDQNYFEELSNVITKKLDKWVNEIENNNLSSDNLFIIDVSDQYIGAFRLKQIDHSFELTYGIIKNPIEFEIKDVITKFDPLTFKKVYDVDISSSTDNFRLSIKKSLAGLSKIK